jgi:hypothetical protein
MNAIRRHVKRTAMTGCLATAMLLAGAAGRADAGTISLTNAAIAAGAWSFLVDAGSVSSHSEPPLSAGFNQFEAHASSTGAFEVTWTHSPVGLSASAGDTFALLFYNSNAHEWDFTLAIETVGGGVASFMLPIVNGSFGLLSVIVPDSTGIAKVIVGVDDVTPKGPSIAPDYEVDFNVIGLPEPGTISFLAFSLLGLGGFSRRFVQ